MGRSFLSLRVFRTQGSRFAGRFLASKPPGKLEICKPKQRGAFGVTGWILLGRLQTSEIFRSRFFFFAPQKMAMASVELLAQKPGKIFLIIYHSLAFPRPIGYPVLSILLSKYFSGPNQK